MTSPQRRKLIKGGLAFTGLGLLTGSVHAASPTPKETPGPFYPITPQKDKDFDLTQIKGNTGMAKGQKIIIEGQVVDTHGKPIEDVTVDLWQANAAGRYNHPHDNSDAPLDPSFQGWAIVPSGKKGKFRFLTVMPGNYAVSKNWIRPSHIHFKVSKRGYHELVTQMYFPDNKLNDTDGLLQKKTKKEAAMMIAKKISDKPETYSYQIVLEKV